MPEPPASFDPLTRVDPWAALRDGRMQLLAALDGLSAEQLDLRLVVDGLELRLAEAAALHAAWDRLHNAFFAGLVAGEVRAVPEPVLAGLETLETPDAVVEHLDGARREMLGAAATIDVDRYEERVPAPWDASLTDSVRGYLVAMAMRDGIFAQAIVEARETP